MVSDLLEAIEQAGRKIAHAITPCDACAGEDANGGSVSSLTEAVMGVTAGLCRVADAISELAEAVRDQKESE